MNYVDCTMYLGVTLSCDKLDGTDMLRQLRPLYAKSNRLLRMFHECSYEDKLALFCNSYTCFIAPTFRLITNCLVIVN